MNKITLLLVLHNHQPVGNLESVFRQATSDCYRPLVELATEFPNLHFTFHFTGPLWNWLEDNSPDILDKLEMMVGRDQVEMLGGGFYEPMLAVLPEQDARGQLQVMKDRIKTRFGMDPQGLWTAERVWEPDLARIMSGVGYKYTLLDDYHFYSAGITDELDGYYITEKGGDPLAIFPINQKLRYAIPYYDPEVAVQEILEMGRTRNKDEVILTYGDDGEKFGVWPGTKNLVWDRKWLRRFFEELEAHSREIQTSTPGKVLKKHVPQKRIYLPTASYAEMGEWSLVPEAQQHYNSLRKLVESFEKITSMYKQNNTLTELTKPCLESIENLPADWLESYINFMHKGGRFILGGSRKISSKLENFSGFASKLNSVFSFAENMQTVLEGSNILMKVVEETDNLLEKLDEIQQGLGDNDPKVMDYYIHGGIWQGFLAKYHESNLVHKRMIYVSERLKRIESNQVNIDRKLLSRAKEHLYKAQCNCAYWHGIFGGLYMVHLRHALYHHLLRAEHLLDHYEQIKNSTVERIDFDKDLTDELVFSGKDVFACIKPSLGGSLIEYDVKPRYFNITNVMTRVEEGYHHGLVVAEEDEHNENAVSIHDRNNTVSFEVLQNKIYDKGPRTSFQDIFLPLRISTDQLAHKIYARNFQDLGDFTFGKYEIVESDSTAGWALIARTGKIDGSEVRVEKEFKLENDVFKIKYKFHNQDESVLKVNWIPESSFTMLGENSPQRRIIINGKSPQGKKKLPQTFASYQNVDSYGMISDWDGFSFQINLDHPSEVHIYPFFSLSQSETSLELNYQGSCFAPAITLELNPGETKEFKFTITQNLFPKTSGN
ncbi:MAG: alpha-amylase/4-alpha-glucanotransferase domain-containing protein [Myxococcota bacterium]